MHMKYGAWLKVLITLSSHILYEIGNFIWMHRALCKTPWRGGFTNAPGSGISVKEEELLFQNKMGVSL